MGTKSGKKPKAKRKLTRKQSRLLNTFATAPTQREAAIAAGYSPKYADQAAHQALKQISAKVPELMDELGYTDRALIEKKLAPLLDAKETKFFHSEKGGLVETPARASLRIRLDALDMAFRLRGSYAPRDAEIAAQIGVKVIIVDTPRPARGVVMADVGPGALPSSNGHKATDE